MPWAAIFSIAHLEDAERILNHHKVEKLLLVDPRGEVVGKGDLSDLLNICWCASYLLYETRHTWEHTTLADDRLGDTDMAIKKYRDALKVNRAAFLGAG